MRSRSPSSRPARSSSTRVVDDAADGGPPPGVTWWASQPRGRQERPRRRSTCYRKRRALRAVRDAAGRSPQRRQLRRRDRGLPRARRAGQGHPARRRELRGRPAPAGAARHRRRRHRARRLRAPPDRGARDAQGAAQAVPEAPADRGLRAALRDQPPQDVPGRVRRCVRARRRGDRRQAVRSDEDPGRGPLRSRAARARPAPQRHQGGVHRPRSTTIVKQLAESAAPGDVVCVLSSGSFDGLHDKLLDAIGDAIRPAQRLDMPAVRELLATRRARASPRATSRCGSFFVLRNEQGVVGTVALEVLGDDAILRALAVDPEFRGAGYGWMLADMAVSQARWRGVRRIYLLTESASDFFAAKFGFRVVDRSTLSQAGLGERDVHARHRARRWWRCASTSDGDAARRAPRRGQGGGARGRRAAPRRRASERAHQEQPARSRHRVGPAQRAG